MAAYWKSKWWGWAVQVRWVVLHAFCVGTLLVLDSDLRRNPLGLIAALYYALLALTVTQFFGLAGSSPGYVREAIGEDASFEERAQTALNSTLSRPTPRRGRANQEPLMLEPDSCKTCGEIQPFRTKHCIVCDKCVLRFDHHCLWIGTCIGQKNHRRFWWFLLIDNLFLSWTAIEYVSTMKSIGEEKRWTLLVIVVVIVLVLVGSVLYIALLFVYQTYLAVTNQTTYERLRTKQICYLQNLPDGMSHPFSRGCAGNVQSFYCPPSEAYPVYNLPTPEEIEATKGRRCCI